MDNSDYRYKPNYHYSERRDKREDSPPSNRVSGHKYREFSPVKPRNRSPQHERIDRHSPPRQSRGLSRSTEAPSLLQGRFRALHPDHSPLVRIRPLIQRSAPAMQRPSPAELRRQAYIEELNEYDATFVFSQNFDEKIYEGIIEQTKNFEIAKRYFNDLKDSNLKATGKTYCLLVKKALDEDKNQEAEEIAQEAALELGIDVYTELIETLMSENKPQQAFKMLKQGGLNKLPILLKAAERSKNPLPDFVLEHLMQLCRHKGDQPAHIEGAHALYMYTQINHIRASKDFYIKLADVYFERDEYQQAHAIFNHFIGFEIKIENSMEKVDLHGLTPRVGLILIREYLNKKRDNSPFIVVTGQGHNSAEGVQFIMRNFIIANFSFVTKNWLPYVPHDNPGMLIVQLKPS